ncbi:MAG TPA: hypothetical protein VM120_18915 [Bryobacteraceae bacterium]|nr:hypothetical protein [Bryobacteraceae bacterium]
MRRDAFSGPGSVALAAAPGSLGHLERVSSYGQARVGWTGEAADYLRLQFQKGDSVFATSGDLLAIFRKAGIPLRHLLYVDNGLLWEAARLRPDLFLRCRWAVLRHGDPEQEIVRRYFVLAKRIETGDAKALEIYARRSPIP